MEARLWRNSLLWRIWKEERQKVKVHGIKRKNRTWPFQLPLQKTYETSATSRKPSKSTKEITNPKKKRGGRRRVQLLLQPILTWSCKHNIKKIDNYSSQDEIKIVWTQIFSSFLFYSCSAITWLKSFKIIFLNTICISIFKLFMMEIIEYSLQIKLSVIWFCYK